MRRGIVAAAALLIAAAPTPWVWRLPPGVAPPPVPADNPITAAKVALGRRLFYDADLSVDGTMACATCHEQSHGFADGNRTHGGVHGEPGRRNVPGLANVAWLPSLTWGDPTVRSLEAQSAIPLTGDRPIEMGMTKDVAVVARRLRRDACYRRLFRAAFPNRRDAIDWTTIGAALASFQRTLVSFDVPVDSGEVPAESTRGFAAHCAACHAGPTLSDGRFHKLRAADPRDLGLGEVTGRRADHGFFRTPSLRNVAVTGPWLHDGSAETLRDAIDAHGLRLDPRLIQAMLSYLDTLTDRAFLTDPRHGYPNTCSASVVGR